MGVKQAIKNLDAFPRPEEHLLQKTRSGAIGTRLFVAFRLFISLYVHLNLTKLVTLPLFCFTVSIIGLLIMATLFLHELQYYLTTYTVHQVFFHEFLLFISELL